MTLILPPCSVSESTYESLHPSSAPLRPRVTETKHPESLDLANGRHGGRARVQAKPTNKSFAKLFFISFVFHNIQTRSEFSIQQDQLSSAAASEVHAAAAAWEEV